jgi:hypothetical protein
MNDALHLEYVRLLRAHNVAERSIPPNATEIAKRIAEEKIAAARAAGDDDYAKHLEEVAEARMGTNKHPATLLIESAAKHIEHNIGKMPEYNERFDHNVYVGEFPTGSFNAQVTAVDGGYIVLINAGALVLIQAIVSLLVSHKDLGHISDDDSVVESLAKMVLSYFQHRDPMFGPLPMTAGHKGVLAASLSHATQAFVIGHEYGHILAGHLGNAERQTILTNAGDMDVISKSHDKELEADRIGFELLLGEKEPQALDFSAIDNEHPHNVSALMRLMEKQSLIVAPLLFFEIDSLLTDTYASIHEINPKIRSVDTHPTAPTRINPMISALEGIESRFLTLLNYATAITRLRHKVCERITAVN